MPEQHPAVPPVVVPDRQELEECLARARARLSAIAAVAVVLGPPRRHKSVLAPADLSHHPGSPTLIVLDDLPTLTPNPGSPMWDVRGNAVLGTLVDAASLHVDDLDERT